MEMAVFYIIADGTCMQNPQFFIPAANIPYDVVPYMYNSFDPITPANQPPHNMFTTQAHQSENMLNLVDAANDLADTDDENC